MKVISVLVFFPTVAALSFRGGKARGDEASSVVSSMGSVGQRDLQTSLLEQRWNITEPTFAYSNLVFSFNYPMSNYIEDAFIKHTLYDSFDCQEGGNDITDNDFLAAFLLPDGNGGADGTGTRTVGLTLGVVTDTISTSPIYGPSQGGASGDADIKFCVRMSVYNRNKNDEEAVEVNFIETLVSLRVDLTDGFQIDDLIVNPLNRNEVAVSDTCFVEAYECDQNNEEVINPEIRNQGDTIKVCVEPTQDSLAKGCCLKRLDWFNYFRDEPGRPSVFQEAIVSPGQETETGLTLLDCQPGTPMCSFDTILRADFYDFPGIAQGEGLAVLQFCEADLEGDNEGSDQPASTPARDYTGTCTNDDITLASQLGRQSYSYMPIRFADKVLDRKLKGNGSVQTFSENLDTKNLPMSRGLQFSVSDLHDDGIVAADLVQELVGDPNVIISNITFTGSNRGAGIFSGGHPLPDGIGIESGIILGSGDVNGFAGPNSLDGATFSSGYPGDSDLNNLISPYTTYEAVVLEFDFECPTGVGEMSFQYVFTSDEYNEYVNSMFNDVFGFFVNNENIALVPGTNVPVSINTINCGNFGGGAYNYPDFATNCHIYRNNDLSDGGGNIDTEMDGLTVVLSAQISDLPEGVNHFKIAIADAGDGILDSNVLLRSGSFVCAAPDEPPVAVCLKDAVVEATTSQEDSCLAGAEEAARNDFSWLAPFSYDADGDALTFSVDSTGPFDIGPHEVTVTCSDGVNTATCVSTFTVEDTNYVCSHNPNVVTFVVENAWTEDVVDWVATKFVDPTTGALQCIKEAGVTGEMTSTFTAQCTGGFAQVFVYVHDESFTGMTDPPASQCENAAGDLALGYEFIIPCGECSRRLEVGDEMGVAKIVPRESLKKRLLQQTEEEDESKNEISVSFPVAGNREDSSEDENPGTIFLIAVIVGVIVTGLVAVVLVVASRRKDGEKLEKTEQELYV